LSTSSSSSPFLVLDLLLLVLVYVLVLVMVLVPILLHVLALLCLLVFLFLLSSSSCLAFLCSYSPASPPALLPLLLLSCLSSFPLSSSSYPPSPILLASYSPSFSFSSSFSCYVSWAASCGFFPGSVSAGAHRFSCAADQVSITGPVPSLLKLCGKVVS
jgi:hypothetical protein